MAQINSIRGYYSRKYGTSSYQCKMRQQFAVCYMFSGLWIVLPTVNCHQSQKITLQHRLRQLKSNKSDLFALLGTHMCFSIVIEEWKMHHSHAHTCHQVWMYTEAYCTTSVQVQSPMVQLKLKETIFMWYSVRIISFRVLAINRCEDTETSYM